MQAWVGQQQARVLQPQLSPEKQIQIQGPGPPTLFTIAIAAVLRLQRLKTIQQRQRRLRAWSTWHTADQEHGIAVQRLTGRPSNRSRLQQGRP